MSLTPTPRRTLKILTEEVEILAPVAIFSVTAEPAGSDTTLLRFIFSGSPSALDTLAGITITDSDITVSSGLTKGTLTKISDTEYTLDVTVTATGTTKQTVKVNVPGVAGTTISVTVKNGGTVIPPPTSPLGWYGAWYPNSTGSFNPIDASCVDMVATTEITGSKRTLVTNVGPDEVDWNAIEPSPPEVWGSWDDAGYKIFIAIRGTEWGSIQAWDSTESFNQTAGCTPFSMVVEGVTYNCIISPILGGVTPINFKFV